MKPNACATMLAKKMVSAWCVLNPGLVECVLSTNLGNMFGPQPQGKLGKRVCGFNLVEAGFTI